MDTNIKHICCSYLQKIPVYSGLLAAIVCVIITVTDIFCDPTISNHLKITYEILVINAGFLIIFLFSKAMGLCRVQMFGLMYTYLFILCLWLRRYPEGEYGAFGKYIHIFHFIVCIIGICYAMFVLYMRRICRKK